MFLHVGPCFLEQGLVELMALLLVLDMDKATVSFG
jgi:hypothetical protein